MFNNSEIADAMTVKLSEQLPEMPDFVPGIRRAPNRGFHLSKEQTKIALKNALRYVPESLHEKLAPEFLNELLTKGRIYAYRSSISAETTGNPCSRSHPDSRSSAANDLASRIPGSEG